MNKSELLNRLSDIEWEDFEVKDASGGFPKSSWETVSAFSNSAGGWIVFGVSQKGNSFDVTGASQPEKLEQDFTTVLRSQNKFNVLITPKCQKYNIDGLTVLAFYISSSTQKPVYFNALANTFIRTGSGDQRATESEINALLRDQLFGAMSARPAEKTSIQDLNRTTLYRYRDYMTRFNPGLPYNAMPESDFLEKMQIIEGEHLTYGGLLFMGNNLAINKSFPDFRVDLLEIPGISYADAVTRYTFRLEEQENLWEYYFAIIERLKRQVDMPFKMNELGIAIEDSPQFDAIREALVNLLMHTDYFSPAKPRVRVFTDRIEFENPGAFPRSIDELLRKDISIPRNPVITRLFRCAKLAENAGYGFDKMLKWEASTKTKVMFENSIDMSVITFRFPETEDTENTKGPEKGPEKGPVKGPEKVTANQQKILNNIGKKPDITREELAAKVGISLSKIKENISKLKNKGLLERIGPDKGGYWKILTKKENNE
jgi:ATP-dependent DNA helicase RecG